MREVTLTVQVPNDFPGNDEEYEDLVMNILDRYGNEEYFEMDCGVCGEHDHLTSTHVDNDD